MEISSGREGREGRNIHSGKAADNVDSIWPTVSSEEARRRRSRELVARRPRHQQVGGSFVCFVGGLPAVALLVGALERRDAWGEGEGRWECRGQKRRSLEGTTTAVAAATATLL